MKKEKKCNVCEKVKDAIEFPKRKYDSGKVGLAYRCWECKRRMNRERMRKKRANSDYRKRQRELEAKRRRKNPEKELHKRAKKRAKQKGIAFNLDIKDISMPDKCPILGIELEVQTGGANDHSPSLDRIDTTRGYIKGNVGVISRLANIMKAHATEEQLLTFAKNIKKYISSPE